MNIQEQIEKAWREYWLEWDDDASYTQSKRAFEAGYYAASAVTTTHDNCPDHDLYDDGKFYRCYHCDYKERV